MRRKRLLWLIALALAVVVGVLSFRPGVYLPTHRHCIKQAGMALHNYADSNLGRFRNTRVVTATPCSWPAMTKTVTRSRAPVTTRRCSGRRRPLAAGCRKPCAVGCTSGVSALTRPGRSSSSSTNGPPPGAITATGRFASGRPAAGKSCTGTGAWHSSGTPNGLNSLRSRWRPWCRRASHALRRNGCSPKQLFDARGPPDPIARERLSTREGSGRVQGAVCHGRRLPLPGSSDVSKHPS